MKNKEEDTNNKKHRNNIKTRPSLVKLSVATFYKLVVQHTLVVGVVVVVIVVMVVQHMLVVGVQHMLMVGVVVVLVVVQHMFVVWRCLG